MLRFKLLSAAALLLPVAAGAQVTGSRVNPGVNPAAEREHAEDDSGTSEPTGTTVLAEREDIRAGAEVLDTEGGLVGTIESVEADGAVIATGNLRAKLPFGSFGKNARGLVISLTRDELEAAARAQGGG